MKKILLASTALLAFGALSAAQAAEPIQLSVGGFMKQQLIYADNKDYMHYNDFDEQGFGQVNFKGSTKLDNGIEVGVAVETLATQWNDSRNASGARGADLGSRAYGNSNVRRAYMTVSSKFGQAILGQREDFGYITGVSAPDVGWGLQGGDWPNVMIGGGGFASTAGYYDGNNSRYTSRADKMTLVTPTFEGFSVGFSYVPDIRQSWTGDLTQAQSSDAITTSGTNSVAKTTNANGLINRADFGGDMYLAGLAYKNTLGPVGVKANFDFGQYNISNLRTYQGGVQATYAGFTVGGSIFARNADSDARVVSGTTAYTGLAAQAIMHTGMNWDAGVSYATGPYSVSLGYFHDTTKRSGAFDSYGSAADSTQVYALSGKYNMGPGVDWMNSLYYVDYKNNSGYVATTDAQKAATNNDGVAFITGLQVAF